jgi:drug/metabolite transporter (DMT)-like permease
LRPLLLVLLGSILAAAGQVFLKLGADGVVRWPEYLNVRVFGGFALYGVGSILWVVALSKWPLSRVYPFTVFTFVLVYLASFALLGEKIGAQVVTGAALVIAGLVVIVTA